MAGPKSVLSAHDVTTATSAHIDDVLDADNPVVDDPPSENHIKRPRLDTKVKRGTVSKHASIDLSNQVDDTPALFGGRGIKSAETAAKRSARFEARHIDKSVVISPGPVFTVSEHVPESDVNTAATMEPADFVCSEAMAGSALSPTAMRPPGSSRTDIVMKEDEIPNNMVVDPGTSEIIATNQKMLEVNSVDLSSFNHGPDDTEVASTVKEFLSCKSSTSVQDDVARDRLESALEIPMSVILQVG